MHLLGAWARPRGSAVLWHLHDYAGRRPFTARLLRRYAHRCSAVVANSQSVADDVRQVCGGAVPIHPVWNAVDLERFSPDGPRLDLDARLWSSRRRRCASRRARRDVCPLEGARDVSEGAGDAAASLPVRGYIVGGPVYETSGSQVSVSELRELVDVRSGSKARVGFTASCRTPSTAMRALDIVVHASTDPEPFGLVIAEAMACGKPVVVSRAGGASELTEPGVNALAFTPGDAAELARRIEELARDANLRERLGRRRTIDGGAALPPPPHGERTDAD